MLPTSSSVDRLPALLQPFAATGAFSDLDSWQASRASAARGIRVHAANRLPNAVKRGAQALVGFCLFQRDDSQ